MGEGGGEDGDKGRRKGKKEILRKR